jgi:hypothetical protein
MNIMLLRGMKFLKIQLIVKLTLGLMCHYDIN